MCCNHPHGPFTEWSWGLCSSVLYIIILPSRGQGKGASCPFSFLKFIDVLCSEGKAQIINEELGEFSQKDIPDPDQETDIPGTPRNPLRCPFQSACLPDFLVP